MDEFDSPQYRLQEYMDDLLRDPAPALRRVVEEGDYADAERESLAQTRARVARLLKSGPPPKTVNLPATVPVAEKEQNVPLEQVLKSSLQKTLKQSLNESPKTAVEESRKTTTEQAQKTAARQTLKTDVQAPLKTAVDSSLKTDVRESLKTASDHSLKTGVRESLKTASDHSLKTDVRESLKTAVDPSLKAGLRESLQTGVQASQKTVAGQPLKVPETTLREKVAPAPVADGLRWLDNGRPPWAQGNFEVLLFKVSGLTLAVPLISLGQIQPLTKELTPIFGQADWFMGLQPTATGKIRTVNTARFVMPERYDERFVETAKYVISIDGLPWGLAVDSVNQPITLDPGDVKWRTERSKRPWLAGTVKAHMCALIDIAMMGKLLVDTDANGRT